MTRDERHKWLFAHMDGRKVTFTQTGMPFRIMRPEAVVGGVVYIGDCKCRVRMCQKPQAEHGKRYEVRFPDTEIDGKVPMEETTLVGYLEIKGNWGDGLGVCIFHPVGTEEYYGKD
jgi:hypothetical protein